MKSRSRSVTVLIQRDGTTKTHTFRIRLWTLRLGAWLLALVAVLLLLLVVLYGPMVRAAARVPGMERELSRLRPRTREFASFRPRSTAQNLVMLRFAR